MSSCCVEPPLRTAWLRPLPRTWWSIQHFCWQVTLNHEESFLKKYLLNIAEPWRWLRTEVGRKVEKEEEEEEEMEDPPTWRVWLSSWIVLSRMKMLRTEKMKEPGEGVELNRWGRYKANLNQCELKWRDHVHSPLMHRWGSNQPAVAQTP